jgi:hypothetical protein
LKRVKKLETGYMEMMYVKRKEMVNKPKVTHNINFTTSPDVAVSTTDSPGARPRAPPAVQACNVSYIDSYGCRFMATPSKNLAVATRILATY